MRKELDKVEVGDRVWVSSHVTGRRDRLKRVEKLTPTQIIVDLEYKSEYGRYNRGKKSRYGGVTYSGIGGASGRIMEIATADECAKWDAERAAKAEASAVFKRQQEAKEAKRLELDGLFPDHAHVSESGSDRGYSVTFWGLTEEQVKKLAAIVGKAATVSA